VHLNQIGVYVRKKKNKEAKDKMEMIHDEPPFVERKPNPIPRKHTQAHMQIPLIPGTFRLVLDRAVFDLERNERESKQQRHATRVGDGSGDDESGR
jgi:hypothetical protein